MRSLAVRFGVAVIACVVGVGASNVLSTIRSSRSDDQCCDRALVTVEENHGLPTAWPAAPARISVSEIQRSYNLSEVDMTFHVESLNGKSIANFEVWAVKSHDTVVDEYKRILAHNIPMNNLGPSTTAATEYTETVCVSLERGFFRKRTDNVRLYLGSIEFTDGTRWHVPFEL